VVVLLSGLSLEPFWRATVACGSLGWSPLFLDTFKVPDRVIFLARAQSDSFATPSLSSLKLACFQSVSNNSLRPGPASLRMTHFHLSIFPYYSFLAMRVLVVLGGRNRSWQK
jgi:hypothetical protein